MKSNIANATSKASKSSIEQSIAIATMCGMTNPHEVDRIRLLRLKELIDLHDGQNKLAEALRVTPGYINQLVKERRPVSEKTARNVENRLGLSPGWMDEPQVVEGTMRVNIGPPNMNANMHANVHPGPETRGLVPLISWVQAGEWHEADDHLLPGQGEGWYPCLRSHGLNTYALRVEGDSMTAPHGKSYPQRCIIYVDPDQAGGVVSGDRVIAKIVGDDKVTFKTFVEDAGQRFLKPLNPQYPLIRDEFRVIGKVIGKWEDE